MQSLLTTPNLKAILTYPTRDQDWKNKLLITSLVLFAGFLIPILPMLFYEGYQARIIRRGQEGAGVMPDTLPEWDDWQLLLRDGFKMWSARILYALPFLLFGFVFLCLAVAGFFLSLLSKTTSETAFPSYMFLFTMVFMVYGLLTTPLALVLNFFFPAILSHVAVSGEFSAAFRFKEWWQLIRKNWQLYLAIFSITIGIGFVVSIAMQVLMITIIFIFIFPLLLIPISAYISLVTAGMWGTAYRDARRNGAE